MSAHPQSDDVIAWVLEQGMGGASQMALLQGYCEGLVRVGLPLARVQMTQSAYHPKFGAIGCRWMRDEGVIEEEYEIQASAGENWRRSPLYHLLSNDLPELREHLVRSNEPSKFPLLNELKEAGATDYFAAAVQLGHSRDGEAWGEDRSEGILISWTSDGRDGFSDDDLDTVRYTLPHLALALKSASNRRLAEDLLSVYLGQDAGLRVLSGEIQRGSLQMVNAAIANFDLSGFTSLSEALPPADVIELLNDYLGLAVSSIEAHGGHVLKFMGDGVLAMFDCGDETADAAAALAMATELQAEMRVRNAKREAQGRPVTEYTLALHAGDILYGNIGAETRLDFTVIGPAVNQTARLAEMHRSLGRSVIISQAVATAAPEGQYDLVSMGRYMLRGVPHPQMLFTIYNPDSA